MNLNLPVPVLRKLEQVLAQWRQWRDAGELPGAPHIVAPLNGISNHTVLAEAADQRFCIRLDRVNPAANGLNRQVEWRALNAAHAAGIAPRPRYFNPELGVLVCDYLTPDDKQAVDATALAGLLQKIHQLPPLHYRLDLAERIRRYQRQLPPEASRAKSALGDDIIRLVGELTAAQTGAQLCHNDLNPGNLLRSGGKLYALDWEYCAMGSPWFDLAVSCIAGNFDSQTQEQLLQTYLQRPTADTDRGLLLQWSCVARYLELLWYQSQRPDFHDDKAINASILQLTSMVERCSQFSIPVVPCRT